MPNPCLPPPGTPAGTVCVLERERGESVARILPKWCPGIASYDLAGGESHCISADALARAGWSFVRVAGETDNP